MKVGEIIDTLKEVDMDLEVYIEYVNSDSAKIVLNIENITHNLTENDIIINGD